MLNKELCWTCRKDLNGLDKYVAESTFDRLWRAECVFCIGESASIFTTDDVPEHCVYHLEQLMKTVK